MFKRIVFFSFLALILAAGIAYWQAKDTQSQAENSYNELPGEIKTTMQIIPTFELTDQNGDNVTENDFNQYKLILFGYTFCPDFCPTELNIIANALQELTPSQKEQLDILFVSVDPQRDTPQQLKEYTSLFDQKVIGLTGSKDQIDQIKENFKVYSAEVPGSNKNGDDYLIDHSTFVYFLGPDNQLISLIRHGTSPELLAEILKKSIN